MASSVWPDTEVIQPSFCRSSGPLLRLRSVLSEVSNSNQLEFLRVCIDPFETAQALFLCSVLGRVWLCLLPVWFLDPETSVICLCLPCEMLLRVPFWHRRSLSCFLMSLWCRQPRPRWKRDPLSLLLRTSNGHSCFWWTPVSVGGLPVPYTSCYLPVSNHELIYSVGILTSPDLILVLQTSVTVPDTLLPLLFSAGKPSLHQNVASHGPAALIVEVESWMSLASR